MKYFIFVFAMLISSVLSAQDVLKIAVFGNGNEEELRIVEHSLTELGVDFVTSDAQRSCPKQLNDIAILAVSQPDFARNVIVMPACDQDVVVRTLKDIDGAVENLVVLGGRSLMTSDQLRSEWDSGHAFVIGAERTDLPSSDALATSFDEISREFQLADGTLLPSWSCDIDGGGVAMFCWDGADNGMAGSVASSVALFLALRDGTSSTVETPYGQLSLSDVGILDASPVVLFDGDNLGNSPFSERSAQEKLTARIFGAICPDCGGAMKVCGTTCPDSCNNSCSDDGQKKCCTNSGFVAPD